MMKKGKLIFKFIGYYIMGFILFTIIAYVIHLTLFAILTNNIIIPQIEIQLFPYQLFHFFHWYIGIYTILYFLILYIVHKYDIYTVNKLNKELKKMKGEERNEQN